MDAKQSHDDAQRARPARAAPPPECVAAELCGTNRFTISVPAELRAMMLASRRAILAAAVPKMWPSTIPRPSWVVDNLKAAA